MKNPIKDEKDSDSYRVLRGGGWNLSSEFVRASIRDGDDPSVRYDDGLGFRLVKNIPKRRNEESSKK